MVSERMLIRERMRAARALDHSLTEVLEIAARTLPDQAALIFAEETIPYRAMLERARRVAAFLRARGLRPGDRVAVHIDNRPEFAYVAGGVLLAGGVIVAMNVMYLEDEVRYILADSGARFAFCVDALAPRTTAVHDGLPDLEAIIAIGDAVPGTLSFASALAHGPLSQPHLAAGDDLAMLQYTSG